jgi:hypothetical protein
VRAGRIGAHPGPRWGRDTKHLAASGRRRHTATRLFHGHGPLDLPWHRQGDTVVRISPSSAAKMAEIGAFCLPDEGTGTRAEAKQVLQGPFVPRGRILASATHGFKIRKKPIGLSFHHTARVARRFSGSSSTTWYFTLTALVVICFVTRMPSSCVRGYAVSIKEEGSCAGA